MPQKPSVDATFRIVPTEAKLLATFQIAPARMPKKWCECQKNQAERPHFSQLPLALFKREKKNLFAHNLR